LREEPYFCPYLEAEPILYAALQRQGHVHQNTPNGHVVLLTSIQNRFHHLEHFLYNAQVQEIIAILPWLNLINSDHNFKTLFAFGVKAIYPIPRAFFKTRVQLALIHLLRHATASTINPVLHTI
jgi:hypothetical protein